MNINPKFLTLDEVRNAAPAAFTTIPGDGLSDSYSHVTTANVIDALQQDGWLITNAAQRRTRRGFAGDHGRHEITLWHPELPDHKEGRPIMKIGNSSDGSYAVREMGGFLRFACLNQLYTGLKVVGGVFNHRGGGLEDRIVAGARQLRAKFPAVLAQFDRWSTIQLSPDQQLSFAEQAVEFRWPATEVHTSLNEIVAPRRSADLGNDLWSTFNRAQEALIRGGFRATFVERNEAGDVVKSQVRKVRKITGLTANERINTSLHELAEEFETALTVA